MIEDGHPVGDLQPYLGAYGHLVALRAGGLAYLHVHPSGEPGDGTTKPGPEVSFTVTAPTAGRYRLFFDFQHEGKVRTAAFTVHTTGTRGFRGPRALRARGVHTAGLLHSAAPHDHPRTDGRMFPETVLHTDRLVLRPFTAADAQDTQASCADALTQRRLPLPRPYTLAAATAWCTSVSHALRESGDGIHFAVTDTRTERLMGTVGLKKTDWRGLTSEVGYWVSPWARGHGIAAEATRALARWALTDHRFERLELRAATADTASRKTALAAGFHHEGILRNAGFVHDGRVDLVLFSLVADDLRGS
ncbi:hypothetical protein GCM10023100_74820 [Actinocorallia cavernae]|uniref:N-acetyltransferase domain-containing protein n=3 Tax=Actinomycetes TaxID=1760 RepID=A0ABP8T774_9ACTN